MIWNILCRYDYVEILDGSKGNPGPWNKTATLCRRSQRGQVFYSSGASAKIRFVTDGSLRYRGFKIKAQSGTLMISYYSYWFCFYIINIVRHDKINNDIYYISINLWSKTISMWRVLNKQKRNNKKPNIKFDIVVSSKHNVSVGGWSTTWSNYEIGFFQSWYCFKW